MKSSEISRKLSKMKEECASLVGWQMTELFIFWLIKTPQQERIKKFRDIINMIKKETNSQ